MRLNRRLMTDDRGIVISNPSFSFSVDMLLVRLLNFTSFNVRRRRRLVEVGRRRLPD